MAGETLKIQLMETYILQKNPIYRKNVFTLTWGGFSGNSKEEYISKLQCKQFFFAFTGHLAVKIAWSFFNVL